MSTSDSLRALAREITSQTSILPAYVESISARLEVLAQEIDAQALAAMFKPYVEPPAGTPLTAAELASVAPSPSPSPSMTIITSTQPEIAVSVPTETPLQQFEHGVEKLADEIGIHIPTS